MQGIIIIFDKTVLLPGMYLVYNCQSLGMSFFLSRFDSVI